jgi:hypothetical protein
MSIPPRVEVTVPDSHPGDSSPERLPESVAARLLTRAAELDAVRTGSTSVAELRVIAREAGISTNAFDAALAELRESQVAEPVARQRARSGVRTFAVSAAAVFVLFSGWVVSRRVVPEAAAVQIAEASITLRCLSAAQAAELIRPLLRLEWNTIAFTPARDPNVVRIRGTPAQMDQVRDLLRQRDGAGSSACTVRPDAPAPR